MRCARSTNLRTGLLLLLPEEGRETHTRDLHDLETHTGNITLGLTLTTETFDQYLIVLIHKVETTVEGHEGRHLLTVLDQLNTDTLADSRVGRAPAAYSAESWYLVHQQSASGLPRPRA